MLYNQYILILYDNCTSMDGHLMLLLVLSLSQISTTSSGFPCNGSPQYCGLRFNQFTFPATHNSYSRSQSTTFKLYGNKPVPDTDCFARNQGNSITKQLDNGIRSIEIDTCSKDYFDFWEEKFLTKSYACRKVLYTEPVSTILGAIDAWMKANRNEVVVLSFTGKVQRWSDEAIAKNIKKQLEDLWTPTSERLLHKDLTLNKVFTSSGTWPTLQEAIKLNQRVFLFVHPKLRSHMGKVSWAHDFTWIKQTQTRLKFQESNKCRNLVSMIDEACQTNDKLISVDMFVTRGLPVCATARADACNPLLSHATELCYQQRRRYNLTTNFLKVDYPDRKNGYKILKNVAKTINTRNVELYLGHVHEPSIISK